MGSQRNPRQRTRGSILSHLEKQQQRRRLERRANAHRAARRIGAGSLIELVQLHEHADTPTPGEG